MASEFSCSDPKLFDTEDNWKNLKHLAVENLEHLTVTYSDVIESGTEIVQKFISPGDMYKDVNCIRKGRRSSDKETQKMVVTINSVGHPNSWLPMTCVPFTLPCQHRIRSTMNDRLSNVVQLSTGLIERHFAAEVDFNKVIDRFATMKPTRKSC